MEGEGDVAGPVFVEMRGTVVGFGQRGTATHRNPPVSEIRHAERQQPLRATFHDFDVDALMDEGAQLGRALPNRERRQHERIGAIFQRTPHQPRATGGQLIHYRNRSCIVAHAGIAQRRLDARQIELR